MNWRLIFLSICFYAVTALAETSRPAGMQVFDEIMSLGLTPVNIITNAALERHLIEEGQKKKALKQFCDAAKEHYRKYGWQDNPCGDLDWEMTMTSANGHPLIYKVFGEGDNTTLLLGGVHPDELTPIPLAFRFAHHLQSTPSIYKGRGVRIVVAPLVNPDGFIRNIATRTNANGVDLNRNFLTFDWYDRAKPYWKDRAKRHPQRFPGYFPNSEIETIFQVKLIETYHPNKVVSVHAPLGFLDYDGPGDGVPHPDTEPERKAKQLIKSISQKSKNYRVVDYSFYPGSLGNFSGNERGVPTVTLELETTDPSKIDEYWDQFLPGLVQSAQYALSNERAAADSRNPSVAQ